MAFSPSRPDVLFGPSNIFVTLDGPTIMSHRGRTEDPFRGQASSLRVKADLNCTLQNFIFAIDFMPVLRTSFSLSETIQNAYMYFLSASK